MTLTKWQQLVGPGLLALAAGTAAHAATENTLLTFTGTNGNGPRTGLIQDAVGNLYGATSNGGAAGSGMVYRLSHHNGAWKEKILYSFTGGSGNGDGYLPQMPFLAMDSHGALYGTTTYGGANLHGTVFKLTRGKPQWKEQILYSFTAGSDGGLPWGGVSIDAKGNLYGTTEQGGDPTCNCGVVYELKRGKAGTYTQSVLHTFVGIPTQGCQNGVVYDGAQPNYATPVVDSSGNLFGTTAIGGRCFNAGTVWELSPAGRTWTFSVLYAVDCCAPIDTNPNAGVVMDDQGNLYGEGGYSYIFELVKSQGYAHQPLYTGNNQIGASWGTVTLQNGNLYWSTVDGGGQGNNGTVDELASDGHGGWNYSMLYAFQQNGTGGEMPYPSVMLDGAGNIFGTNSNGGGQGNDNGTVWEITP